MRNKLSRALVLVELERERQEDLKAAGRFEFTCADAGMSNAEKMTVLMEELGEAAREVLTQSERRLARDTDGTPRALRAELVQVAAVAVAWVEALLGEATCEACGDEIHGAPDYSYHDDGAPLAMHPDGCPGILA